MIIHSLFIWGGVEAHLLRASQAFTKSCYDPLWCIEACLSSEDQISLAVS